MSTSSDSIFGTGYSEGRWIQEMRHTFLSEHVIDIDRIGFGPCVYRAPKELRDTKPEAYNPQHLALGPYHHLRPNLYKNQRRKFAGVKKFLSPEQLQKLNLVIESLTAMEPIVRACYDEYLDLDIETLSWILAIDGLYLLHLASSTITAEIDCGTTDQFEFVQDLFMLENQIPVIVLKVIAKALGLPPYDNGSSENIDSELYFFRRLELLCDQHSPLKLNEDFKPQLNARQGHLLHRTYYLIVTNRGIKFQPQTKILETLEMAGELGSNIIEIGNALPSSGDPVTGAIQKNIQFIGSLPWEKILRLLPKGDPDEQNLLVEEIEIPSVSQLNKIAGITFHLTDGGIRDVKYVEEEKKFYLPVIRLDSNSEVILRNLVAFELAAVKPGLYPELAQYVDLMCGIVDTPKDVDILRKSKIIEGDLSNEEIARVFNGIRKSTGSAEKKSNIEKAIETVNKRYDNTRWVKYTRLFKKHVYASWKILTVLSTIILILLLTVQSFCSVYGCSKRWFGS